MASGCIANNLTYLDAREMVGPVVGLITGLDVAEVARESERLPRLLL
jgi:hypothetical protein